MCLVDPKPVITKFPNKERIGYRVFEIDKDGNLYSIFKQTNIVRETGKWLKFVKLFKIQNNINSGWYVFKTLKEAKRYKKVLQQYQNETYVIARVLYKEPLYHGITQLYNQSIFQEKTYESKPGTVVTAKYMKIKKVL